MLKTKSRLFSLPIIGDYVKRMSDNIDRFGLQEGIKKEIERSGSKLEIYGLDKETKEILKTKGVVIACNHPYEIETLALIASLPKRKDINLIANYLLVSVYSSSSKHLIPVYIKHHYSDVRSTKFRKLSGKILDRYFSVKHFLAEEEHRKNIESINTAAKKVRDGEIVIIVPSPHRTKNNQEKWYSGIGWLLKNIHQKSDVYYVKAYVAKTSNWDLLRLFPMIGKILPTIKVYFGKPQKIADFNSSNPKELTAKLEKEYLDWITSLH